MTNSLRIPEKTIRLQTTASDPATSAWVSANAGSGKTHVLAQRVVRLLLDDTEPSRILCLTYTRAAAANMAGRVFGDLSKWVLMDDAALANRIADLTGRRPDARRLALARRLFARALETPGGLKIQTIHAFCEAVLQQFPLEANIAGHFELLDAEMETALVAEARRDLITGAGTGEDQPLAEALAEVLERGGEFGLEQLLSDIVSRRDGLRDFIDQTGGPEPDFPALAEEFGFVPGDTVETIAAAAWPLPGLDAGFVSALVRNSEAVGAARLMESVLPDLTRAFRETDPVKRLKLARQALLTGKGEPYGPTAFKKALLARMPDALDRYLEAADAVARAADRMALAEMLTATRAALTLADRLIGRYERLKSARGFLDFNDLINRTVRLLSRSEAGAWVHYRLDRGIDHILIDEAQDTSPQQWQVVKRLAEEFFAGQGARDDVVRTIFAVGDEKQSIYSFQGAEPAAFAESRHEFETRAGDAGERFERIRLDHSFRSTTDVLSAVDLVFSDPARRKGLTRDPEAIEHPGIRDGEPGLVELWSSLAPDTVEEPDDWTRSIDHTSAPAARLADNVADTIAGWLESGQRLEGTGRRITPGDIMVLVRKRDSFVHALSRALKDRRVAVAGADRLLLTDHIAVKDLLAIARFVLQPQDDLSLAALLRSPIFGLTDAQLFDLAFDRGPISLYAAMRRRADADAATAGIVAQLDEWRGQAGFRPVFEFFAGILAGRPGMEGARRRFVARLGPEAGEIVDEFLSFCLTVEQTGNEGLEALVATLDGSAPEIKREMDQRRDEVRILTVHAAKGLEAPVVFLVDSGSRPFVDQHLPRLMPFKSRQRLWRGSGFLWRCGSDVANAAARAIEADIRDRAEDEYRRLLYVGMTRARDRLIVCGYHGAKGRPDGTWHAMVEQALLASPAIEALDVPDGSLPAWRYRTTEARRAPPAEAEAATSAEAAQPPALLRDPVAPAPPLSRPLRPSGAALIVELVPESPGDAGSPVLDPQAPEGFALERGTALHRLLQVLPDLHADERESAARRYLDRHAAAWPAGEAEAAWRSVDAILADPAHAPIFAPGSRAEVALMGTIDIAGAPRAVSAKIDRLAVAGNAVLIVDYKTNRAVPAEPPETYVAQLAIYRELLKPIYPGREIRAALLFTAAPALVDVPADAMDAALARLTGA